MTTVSPSFAEIYPYLVQYMGGYNSFDSNPYDFECEDGWFLWALRLATNATGYKNIQQEEDIYGRIAKELNEAMDNGLIEKQNTMPSALLSPYKKGYTRKIISKIFESFAYTASYKDISIQNEIEYIQDDHTEQEIKDKYENLTYEKSLIVSGEEGSEPEELKVRTLIISGIITIYRWTGMVLLILGVISYILLVVNMIIGLKNKDVERVEKFIISSGVLGLLFTLIAGIAYNEVATAYSIKVLYLCGAYPLVTIFSIMTIIIIIPEIKLFFSKKHEE